MPKKALFREWNLSPIWRVRYWGSNDITRTLILTTRFKSANFFFLQIRQSNPEVHWFSRQSDHFLLLNRSQPAWNLDLCRFHQSPVSNQSIALTRYLENNFGCEDKVPPHLAKTKSAETVIWIKKYCLLALFNQAHLKFYLAHF